MNAKQSLPQIPQTSDEFTDWAQVEPYAQALLAANLTAENVNDWLAQWTALAKLMIETDARCRLAAMVNTEDKVAEARFHTFSEAIQPLWLAAEQKFKQMLLASDLQPQGMETPLRQMRIEAALFSPANLPLFTEEQKLANEYDNLLGAQTVAWAGQEVTVEQLKPVSQNLERSVREDAWRLGSTRQLADRAALNDLWRKLLTIRQQIATNAGHADYRSFCWQQKVRLDYTPADCLAFHQAIEEVVVPAAERIQARRRQQLGVETLRPWDLDVDPQGHAPLCPFGDVAELERKTAAIFQQIDPALGARFEMMRQARLLDLDNRKGKAPDAGNCTFFPIVGHPFIFMNAVGLRRDVEILLHEVGHAFHEL